MENLVPLGTGNSRFMKSNIPASTTLAQLIQMWNNGTFPYDIGPLNSAGISQQGTPLNKDTLLKDATAALYGLTNTAVPDDVLAKLAEAAFVEDGAVTDIDGNKVGPQIATGSYVGTGKYGSSNPNTLTFGFVPSLVIISSRFDASRVGGVFQGIFTPAIYTSAYSDMGYCYSFDSSNKNCFAKISGNTLHWYANTANLQLNTSGQTFSYTAIG